MPNYLQDIGLLHLEEGDINRLEWKKGFSYGVRVIRNYYGISYINIHMGNIEFVVKYRRKENGEEEISGFDTHCDGISVWNLRIVEDLTGDGDPLCRKLVLSGKNDRDLIIADVVNADVLPSFLAGEIILLQMIACTDGIRFYESEEAYRENRKYEVDRTGEAIYKDAVDPASLQTDTFKDREKGLFHVHGTVRKIAWDKSFYNMGYEGHKAFIRCTVKTQFGDLDVLANAENIDRDRMQNIEGSFIADCTARLCGDAGIYQYQYGIVESKKNHLKLVRYTLETGDPERLRSVLADHFVYHSEVTGKHMESADEFIDFVRQSREEGKRWRTSYATVEECAKESAPKYPAGTFCLVLDETEYDAPQGAGKSEYCSKTVCREGEEEDGSVIFMDTEGGKISRILQSRIGDYRLMDTGRSSFLIENGVLIKYSGPGGNVRIPDGVTEIGDRAFEGCVNLTGILFPDGLKKIGVNAFENCWNLKDISMPESLEKISSFAFYYCRSLEEVSLPEGVTDLGLGAFYCCDSLRSIRMPARLRSVDAFVGCSALTEITIPEGVTKIDGFKDCSELRKVSLPDSLERIRDETFLNCEKLSDIQFPESVSYVGKNAFYGCKNLKLPAWIVELANAVGIEIEKKVVTGYFGYQETVTIPTCVTGIGAGAFRNTRAWKHVRNVILHDGVKNIGEHAFDGLPLTGIEIPPGVRSIGNGAFSNCRNLEEITIPGSVTHIGSRAFEECRKLRKAVISEGVTGIGAQAFQGCAALEELVLPESLESIGQGAFSKCGSLKEIEIPSGVTNIETTPFFACWSLENVKVSDRNPAFKSIDNVIFSRDGRRLITGGVIAGRYEIPDGVESMEKDALYNSASLREVVCPDSLTNIGDRAFGECHSLTGVTLPDGLRSIGAEAFRFCYNLEDIILPRSLENLGQGAFHGCKSLTGVIIPDGITEVMEGTFRYCSGLTSAAIPESVKSIQKEAFLDCARLTEIRFPAGLTRIGEEAFRGCRGLTSITIPQNVERIGQGAFSCCQGLTSVELPDCEGIFQAFSGCRNLKEYIVPEDSEKYKTIDGVVFSRDGKKLVAYPPGRKCRRYDIPETVEEVCDYAFAGAPVTIIFAHKGVVSFGKYAAHEKEEDAPFVAYYNAECTLKLGKPIYLGPPEELSKKKLRRVKEGIRSAMKCNLSEIEPWKRELQTLLYM